MRAEEKNQNDELLNSFLNRTFFRAWKHTEKERKCLTENGLCNYGSIELDINWICDLNCSYCYVKKYGKEYYPEHDLIKPENIKRNTKILMRWLKENNFKPNIELFSGETLSQKIGVDVLDIVVEEFDEPKIVLPTNMNFLFSEDQTNRILSIKKKAEEKGGYISFSASVDGGFLEENRPPESKKKIRTPEFYDKMFKFCKEHRCGFHPMIAAKNIDKWKDNWLWWQDKLEKYGFQWDKIYLLEVRNNDWDEKSCQDYSEFLEFVLDWTFEKVNKDKNVFVEKIFNKGFNFLSTPFNIIGRGLGCSIQSTLMLRLGDLSIFPCHRLMYDFHRSGQMIVEDGKISRIEGDNVPLFLMENSLLAKNQPYCEQCLMKEFCSFGCLGAQFEETTDPFTPIPSVCRMYHYKIKTMFEKLDKLGVMPIVLERLGHRKRKEYESLLSLGIINQGE
jgi:radical SAM protein with 4Fe4S-binding SPASM domain